MGRLSSIYLQYVSPGAYTRGEGGIFEYRAFVRNSGGGDTGGGYMERGGIIFRILR